MYSSYTVLIHKRSCAKNSTSSEHKLKHMVTPQNRNTYTEAEKESGRRAPALLRVSTDVVSLDEPCRPLMPKRGDTHEGEPEPEAEAHGARATLPPDEHLACLTGGDEPQSDTETITIEGTGLPVAGAFVADADAAATLGSRDAAGIAASSASSSSMCCWSRGARHSSAEPQGSASRAIGVVVVWQSTSPRAPAQPAAD